ncbi:Planctomycete cytochrome C [Posidoniimonas corsicana]|uniref:Planctomycete cytochrome C n=1 Tax=Posidoniimonas corsicana TaxID=1938618 RepID=A0A5C5VDJ0_9BACT|nr:c-type cytochrome domain-containing protein [Posidoniimonas corsicana]TWT35715.1 Planctomycete cytochrome C [Posidoniimonas corsicana]
MIRPLKRNTRAACALLAFFSLCATLPAATLREQRDDLRRAATLLKASARLAEQGRGEDALTQYAEAQEKVLGVAKVLDPKLQRTYARAAEQMAETHKLLTARGLQPPELPSTDPAAPQEAQEAPGRRGPQPEMAGGRFDRGDISFTNQVAPLLVEKCGRCHVDGSRGNFNMATYNSLIQGSETGRVLVPGEGTGGVLMDNLESGSMPPGRPLAPQEMSLISRWITQGAKFDGDNPDANLKNLQQGSSEPMAPAAKPEATRATGDETVSFALDVAPILMDRCANCHVADNRGQLRFAAFQQLIDSSTLSPGDPARSELIQRLLPDAERRMPQGGPPLSDEQIATITTWVREGARFDGQTPTEPLTRSTAFVRAERATPEELTQMREQLSADNWRLGIPDEQASRTSSDRYLVVGSLPEQRLKEIAAAAEATTSAIQKSMGLSPGGMLGKAKQTLYVFDQRIDYGEFVRMVEQRQLPDDAGGHARFDPVDPYACLNVPSDQDPIADAAFAKQLAALVIAQHSGGRAPDWFVEGAARYAAGKANPKDPRVERWVDGLRSAATGMRQPTSFMTGDMPPADAGVVSLHFVVGMARNSRAFSGLLDDLSAGEEFDAAFAKRYKASPQDVATKWAEALKRRG